MATKLVKPVSRELSITDQCGNTGDVIATIKVSGIELRMKGTKRRLFIPWKDLDRSVSREHLPGNMPARHMANPLGWLTQK